MTEQPLLATDVDTFEGETSYDIGYRHGIEGHEVYNQRIPKKERRDYARGYSRGATQRSRDQKKGA